MQKILLLALLSSVLTTCNYPTVEIQTASSVINVYPNPAIHAAYIQVQDPNGQSSAVKVYDPAGKLILDEIAAPGSQTFNVPLQGKPEGTYHVIFDASAKVYQTTFIKK